MPSSEQIRSRVVAPPCSLPNLVDYIRANPSSFFIVDLKSRFWPTYTRIQKNY